MAKRLSQKEKDEIVNDFRNGKTIDELSKEFNYTKLTIVRNLKRNLGEEKYKELHVKSKLINKSSQKIENLIPLDKDNNSIKHDYHETNVSVKTEDDYFEKDFVPSASFTEIAPLIYGIDNATQKDLSSIPISEMIFPKTIYMIVDKKIELETKFLKDFPEWQFLSEEELNRKTIEIYDDIKIAKRFCKREQKVIKVPNTEVFRIVAPILLARGITRLVNSDKLIAL